MITHLEPDILECEVKWALGSITTTKASGDDGIPIELFQILKDDTVKVLHSICQQIWKTQQWPQDWKTFVFIPISKKGKEEKERYSHLNAEFQRITRRDKKAFLSDQCKEIEENNRIGKTRDLVKKIGDTKGTFHVKMGTIKDKNSVNLTEAEDIKKRLQECTEELYRKGLQTQIIPDGVITHLGPDILECKVKWALGGITTNKASGGDGVPVELFQILIDDAVKVLH